MPSPNVLLANEAGIGRGHIANLALIATQLGGGFSVYAALGRRKHAGELAALGVTILEAPALGFSQAAMQDPRLEGNATWGDFIFAMGLARESVLRHSLAFWIKTLTDLDIQILVAEYAPIAMLARHVLAAKGRQIALIGAGTAYSLPPATLESFPQLLPDYGRRVHSEADVLALLNRVIGDYGAPALPSLPALYACDLTLPMSFHFLDPYRTWRSADQLYPPALHYTPAETLHGDEVFVYFSTSELNEPATLAALANLPLPRRAFMPGANAAQTALLAAAGVQVEMAPVPAALIAQRSRLVLHSSQHGILALAALTGLPQVGLPQHLEQSFHGRRAGQQGILDQLDAHERSEAAISQMVQTCYASAPMRASAAQFAQNLRIEHRSRAGKLTTDIAKAVQDWGFSAKNTD